VIVSLPAINYFATQSWFAAFPGLFCSISKAGRAGGAVHEFAFPPLP
jgi:hypothetical protein